MLFIDEAYGLVNAGYSGGDAFGAEAVQTLLKRAEDDRDRLVIVLAGLPGEMDRFLRSNPGLASAGSDQRVTFPSYSGPGAHRDRGAARRAGRGRFDGRRPRDLDEVFAWVCERAGRSTSLGNGRFARSLFERAAPARDVRLAASASPPPPPT